MSTIVLLGGIGVVGFLCQWSAWRIKQPAILFLLVAGIIAGPVTGVLKPDELFGDLLFPLVSLSVAIILFEGSLTLKRQELEGIGTMVWKMVSLGALVGAVVVTAAAHWLAGFSWPLAALFGTIMVVTGPTVIVPLLRAVRPNVRISRILRWEGIIIDPLGALFAVLVFEWIAVQQTNAELSHVAWVFCLTIISGSLIGVLMALPLGLMLRNHWVPEYLHNFASICFVTAAFVLSEAVAHESGLLAVTVMGIWLANMKGVHTRGILEFKESLTLIFVSALFIILAARINFGSIQQLGFGALGVLLVMQLIARPLNIWLCGWRSTLSWREKALLAWIGPRGIVAAAVSALFALRLEQLGYEQAELLVPLSFSIIIGTVLVQSLSSRPLALMLQVSQSTTAGHLIIGATPLARAIGKALHDAGSKVVLCDSYWDNIKEARMLGLPTYYGNPISDHAELHLDTSELSGMLALSSHSERNMASALRFKDDFGVRRIFTLSTPEQPSGTKLRDASKEYRGRVLFGNNISYGKLSTMLSQGGQIKGTPISDSFTFENWRSRYASANTVPLFVMNANEQITWFTEEDELNPKAGSTIFFLTEEERSPG